MRVHFVLQRELVCSVLDVINVWVVRLLEFQDTFAVEWALEWPLVELLIQDAIDSKAGQTQYSTNLAQFQTRHSYNTIRN